MTPLHIDDEDLLTDNNWVENPIRPIATGRASWLFAGSLRAGKGAAAVTTPVHSTRINGLDPFDHLKDILEWLPTQPVSRIQGLAAAQLVAVNTSSPDITRRQDGFAGWLQRDCRCCFNVK